MRAKSIKNTARINAELSPLELKGLLKKAQTANSSYQSYIAALEAEVAIWRSGGSVEQSRWASPENSKAGVVVGVSSAKKSSSPAPSTPPPSTPRAATPSNPLLDNLRSEIIDSRPQTPTVVGLDKDERDEFLKRENELTDQLAEKVRLKLILLKRYDECPLRLRKLPW
jgi:kinesin family member 5